MGRQKGVGEDIAGIKQNLEQLAIDLVDWVRETASSYGLNQEQAETVVQHIAGGCSPSAEASSDATSADASSSSDSSASTDAAAKTLARNLLGKLK